MHHLLGDHWSLLQAANLYKQAAVLEKVKCQYISPVKSEMLRLSILFWDGAVGQVDASPLRNIMLDL